MVSPKSVTQQLRQIGCDYALWGRTEIHELANVLMDNERIMQAVNGYYDGGFALLCTTNYRVLVVDKKPFLLTVEDLRYDMIAEVDYSSRIFTSVLHIYTPMRTLMFTSWSISRLRQSMSYVQQRVMELRNNDYLATQFATATATAQSSLVRASQARVQRKKLFPMRSSRRSRQPTQDVPSYQTQPPIPTQDLAGAAYQSGVPQPQSTTELPEQFQRPRLPDTRYINPYTKVPLLARRRKYPSFY